MLYDTSIPSSQVSEAAAMHAGMQQGMLLPSNDAAGQLSKLRKQGPKAHLDDQVELQLPRRVRVLPIGHHPVSIAAQRPARDAAHLLTSPCAGASATRRLCTLWDCVVC